jgi:hypothetical protein
VGRKEPPNEDRQKRVRAVDGQMRWKEVVHLRPETVHVTIDSYEQRELRRRCLVETMRGFRGLDGFFYGNGGCYDGDGGYHKR